MTSPAPVEPGQRLSAREVQLVTAMANGLDNATIGAQLHISVNTVKSHARRVYRKLGARDRAHAVGLAIATRQLPPRAVDITTPPHSA